MNNHDQADPSAAGTLSANQNCYGELGDGLRDAAPMACVALDRAGRIRELNHAANHLLGVADARGIPLDDFLAADSRPVFAGFLANLFAGSSERHCEVTLAAPDRQRIEAHLEASLAPSGETCVAAIANVTARWRAAATYRRFYETLSDGCVHVDLSGRILEFNRAFREMLGYSTEELLALAYRDLAPESWPAAENAMVRDQILARGSSEPYEQEYRRKDGTVFPVELRTFLIRDDASQPASLWAIARDITARYQAEEELIRAAAVFANTHEGVAITDTAQRIVAVNRAFTELTGYAEAEVLGKTPKLLQSGRHDREFYRDMWAAIQSGGHWHGEIWNRRKTGEIYPELLTISAITKADGEVTGYVGVFSDITRIKNYQAQLELLAHYDPLTGLINRRLLEARLDHAMKSAQRKAEHGALLLIDLDRFKDVNDSFGHPAGDELLQEVARRFQQRLRQSDSLARLGGDEFAVMLEPPMSAPVAAHMAHELLDALTSEFSLSAGARLDIGASIGVSLFPEHGGTVADLLEHTDAALYQAKREGRNTFRFYSEEMTQQAREQLRMEERLRNAMRNNELQVYYQAQIEISSGRVIGAEALVRWLHPEEGLIMPERFIGLSEQTRLIVPLGDWVLKTACRQVEAWVREGLPQIRLAVNLSAIQASRPDVASRIVAILTETGFVPQALELELTETSLRADRLDAINLFVQLQNLGVTLAVDDYGTGYSSLTNLGKYLVNTLKIDRHFVSALPHDRAAAKITMAIIRLAHTLGLRTIAEGVETAEQLEFLAAEGCDACQGYLFSPPLPADEFAQRYLRGC